MRRFTAFAAASLMACTAFVARAQDPVAAVAEPATNVPATAGEMVANPGYVSWSKVKPGTTVTYSNTMTMMGQKMDQTMVQKLVSVADDKAVLEISMTLTIMGQEQKPPANNQDIPAKVAKGSELLPPDMDGEVKELPDEKVTVAGKEYACKVMEFTGKPKQGGDMTIKGKVHRSSEVPGEIVKMTATMTSPMGAGDVAMELKEVKMAE